MRHPNVLVCGTPGCGKTSLAELAAERAGLAHVNVGELVAAKGLHAGRDAASDALLLDEAAEGRIVDELDARMRAGGVLLEHHAADFFPERWFDLVLVLRADNTVLFDRLVKRCVAAHSSRQSARARLTAAPHKHPRSGYAAAKVTENVEAEIMGVVAEEAHASYRAEIVHDLESNTLDDLDRNVERLATWAAQWRADRAAEAAAAAT